METPSRTANVLVHPASRRTQPAVVAGDSIEPDMPLDVRHGGATAATASTTFGRRLRTLRLQVGMSQRQLARSSTLSLRAIRDLENGRVRQPRADTLRLLGDALGLGTPQILQLTNDQAPGFPAGAAEPAASGPFLGREQELAALTTMLGAEHHRLVTITGIEGVGKTRLALEVAHALEAAEHWRVFWLPLDDGQSRRGSESPGTPELPAWLRNAVRSGPEHRRSLVEIVGESNALLVLDGAGPRDELAEITADLLVECPRLRILVTARNPVDMPHETLCPLAPLAVPSSDCQPADLEKVASVALLLAQTKRMRLAFRPDDHLLADIARICRALDGLPAAIESAAHWSLIYSLRQLSHQVTTEPYTVARRPLGGDREAFTSLRRTVAALSSRQRDLLASMTREASGEPDGYWSVPQVADTTGRSVAECADDIYHLLILGILRRVDRREVAMYKVLNMVSIIGSIGRHAAA